MKALSLERRPKVCGGWFRDWPFMNEDFRLSGCGAPLLLGSLPFGFPMERPIPIVPTKISRASRFSPIDHFTFSKPREFRADPVGFSFVGTGLTAF